MRGDFRARRGMALWLALVVAMFLFLTVANLAMLSHGEIQQLSRSEAWVRCDIATRSIYEDLVAGLRTAPWEKRPFRDGPVSRTNAELDGVRYHALIEDTKGADRSADVWISAEREGAKRVVFHRIRVLESVFQKMNRIDTVLFARFNPDEFSEPGSVPALRDRVEKILERRNAKQAETDTLAARIHGDDDFNRIMERLGLPVTGSVVQLQTPFVPGARTGYAQNPALLSFAGLDLSAAMLEGRLAVDSFRTVQAEADARIDGEFAKSLAARLGDRKATSILDKVKRLDFTPGAEERLLAARYDRPGGGLDLHTIEGRILGAAAGGDDLPPVTEQHVAVIPPESPAGGTPDPLAENAAENPVTGSGDGETLVTPPGGAAENPSQGGNTPGETPPGHSPGGDSPGAGRLTFDELITKRDLYDEKFVERWDSRKGLIGAGRSVAAYAHKVEEKYRLIGLMNSGKAEIEDFERYIRAQNTLMRYSITGRNYDKDREKVIKVARDYFAARRGGVVDPDGGSKL